MSIRTSCIAPVSVVHSVPGLVNEVLAHTGLLVLDNIVTVKLKLSGLSFFICMAVVIDSLPVVQLIFMLDGRNVVALLISHVLGGLFLSFVLNLSELFYKNFLFEIQLVIVDGHGLDEEGLFVLVLVLEVESAAELHHVASVVE